MDVAKPASLAWSFVGGTTTVLLGQAALSLAGPHSRAQGTFTQRQGIALLSPDSRYYLRSSETFAAIAEAPWTNWTYLAIVRVGHHIGDAATVTVLVQLLVAIGVCAALHRAITPLVGSTGGWAAAAAFSLNPFVAQWFRFIHTETIFFGIVVLVVLISSRLLLSVPSRANRSDFLVILLGLAAAGARPNGSLVLLSAIALIAWQRLSPRRALAISLLLIISAPAVLLTGLNATGQPFEGSLTSQLYTGVVIEGTEEVRVRILMPAPSDPSDESILAAARYVVAHPLSTVRLAAARMSAEVAQVRPHYARLVNIVAAFAIALYLGTSLVGVLSPPARPLLRPIGLVMIPILLLVGMTFATPEARYGWGGLIALSPAAGIGVGSLLGRGRSSRTRAPRSTA